MLSSLLNEVVALRETVRALDPAFSEVLESRRKESQESNAGNVAALVDSYDQIIERLKAGQIV